MTCSIPPGLARWLARRLAPLLAAAACTTLAPLSWAATLNITCGAVGQDLDFCRRATQAWATQTGHSVNVVVPPPTTTDQLGWLQQQLNARSSELDVVMIDVVWPGLLKDHLVDLRPYSRGAEQQHFSAIVANNTANGRLLAMPWFTDVGLLYYRRDLIDRYRLRVPNTWDELMQTARTIQEAERLAGRREMQGFVFQGKAYEGLSCNVVEWLTAWDAGHIVERDGRISVNNEGAVQALSMAASWIGTISPRQVLDWAEEDTRRVFQDGNAVFMRNWPYAWSLLNAKGSKVAMKVGVSALPRAMADGKRPATLGGWQLAVSRYSAAPQLAAELVLFLTSEAQQKERALKGSYNPTRPALYKDTDVLFAMPFLSILHNVIANAEPRPSTPAGARYPEVSEALWTASHAVLAGQTPPGTALRQLDARLRQLLPMQNTGP